MRLWKLKMKGTTRKMRGWGVYYSRPNQSPFLLGSSSCCVIDDLGSNYVQMTRDTFFEFIAIKDEQLQPMDGE
jgi:hypothetical protein